MPLCVLWKYLAFQPELGLLWKICIKEEKRFGFKEQQKLFFLFENTYLLCLFPTEKRVAMLGRVYHVKLARLVCLKIKMGFRMCLSGLGLITRNYQGIGAWEESRTLPLQTLVPTCTFAFRTSLRAACCVDVPSVLLGFLPAFGALEQLTACLLGAHETFVSLVNGALTVMGFPRRITMTFRLRLTGFTSAELALWSTEMCSRQVLFPVLFQPSTMSEHWGFCCNYWPNLLKF